MEGLKEKLQKLLELGGFKDFSVDVDAENRRASIFIYDFDIKSFLPKLIFDVELLLKLMNKGPAEEGQRGLILDINNYRREREHLIAEIAKAAARKALLNKQDVELPAMNAYERRLVHMELASRPDVKTESVGEGPERRIIVKPI
ncbi:MAG: hypothetical protein PHP03_02070 [Candidatus Pacebacteria bacterium]|nr:hypothetical protein [Candidatus Paceibacterota bacterium]